MTARVTFTNGNVLNASDLTNSFTYLPYMAESGTTTITGSGTINFQNTFDVNPIVVATAVSSTSGATSVTVSSISKTQATVYVWSGSTAATSSRVINWIAYQASPSNAAG